ncbi:MAG: hypothetical protein AAGA74_02315 [Pseudomonadota bacterium]
MIRTASLFVLLSLLVTPVFGQDGSPFSIDDRSLAESLLEEALDIAGLSTDNLTRNPFGQPKQSEKDFDEFEVLQEAYRNDPEATIRLVRRILEAGGRTR